MHLNKISNPCFPLYLWLTQTSDESSLVICTHSALSLAKRVINELLLWLFLSSSFITAIFRFHYYPDTVKNRSKLGNIQQKPEVPYLNSIFPLLCSVLLFSLISISSDRKSHWLEAFRGCGLRVKQRHRSIMSAAHNNKRRRLFKNCIYNWRRLCWYGGMVGMAGVQLWPGLRREPQGRGGGGIGGGRPSSGLNHTPPPGRQIKKDAFDTYVWNSQVA